MAMACKASRRAIVKKVFIVVLLMGLEHCSTQRFIGSKPSELEFGEQHEGLSSVSRMANYDMTRKETDWI
ncbi:hypothetical protein M378DRAFT_167888 [Amanita muscaria Koide BX008]|uniref:Uncharacterized protein n=1 Tax=Amanita muscaria (strain Koide BX008) TaxID=946122 RepID=A0A0C2WWD4_AMAMK|nr:hypothetical protein M378DRAFT_167888 [Amanita muscaria Koide BX008]